jgi:ATP-dependent RNA helicase SUPV3L1/SUV3
MAPAADVAAVADAMPSVSVEGAPAEEAVVEEAVGEAAAVEDAAASDPQPGVDPPLDASAQPALLGEDAPAAAADEASPSTHIETREEIAAPPADVQAADVAAPAEPVVIEVWRPQRHGQSRPARERRAERGRRHAAAAPAALPAEEGASAPDREHREHRRARGGYGKRKDRGDGDRQEGSAAPQDRPQRQEPRDFRGRQERRGNERQERRGNFQGKPKRERPAEKQPDPNSPFAKLLALKQQLEARDTKGERQ